MRLLVHLCCGPCAAYPMPRLLAAGHSVQGFFFNPNIHPFQEFRRRLDALQTLSRLQGWELVADEQYGLTEYLRQVVFDEARRCRHCYDRVPITMVSNGPGREDMIRRDPKRISEAGYNIGRQTEKIYEEIAVKIRLKSLKSVVECNNLSSPSEVRSPFVWAWTWERPPLFWWSWMERAAH